MIYSTDVLGSVNYLWRKADLRVALYYKYNGDYPEVFINADESVSRSIMEGYHTMDLSASKEFFAQRLQAQIGVKNLFNNTNIAVKGDTGGGIHSGGGGSSAVGWGRTFFVRLTFQFQKINSRNEN